MSEYWRDDNFVQFRFYDLTAAFVVVSLISLSILEFEDVFSRAGNSVYLAVFFTKMFLNPLENVNNLKVSEVLPKCSKSSGFITH